MSKVEQLLNMEASSQADIDDLHEKLADKAARRIDELLQFPEERNAEIFRLMGAPVEDSFRDYFDIPDLERDVLWMASLSALAVASRMQAWIEIYGVDAIEMFENNGRRLDSHRKKMSKAELREAALKGIGKARINGEKERRRSKSVN